MKALALEECTRCDKHGWRWVVEEDPETGIWHTVGYRCDHVPPRRHNIIRLIVGLAMVLAGLAGSVWGGW